MKEQRRRWWRSAGWCWQRQLAAMKVVLAADDGRREGRPWQGGTVDPTEEESRGREQGRWAVLKLDGEEDRERERRCSARNGIQQWVPTTKARGGGAGGERTERWQQWRRRGRRGRQQRCHQTEAMGGGRLQRQQRKRATVETNWREADGGSNRRERERENDDSIDRGGNRGGGGRRWCRAPIAEGGGGNQGGGGGEMGSRHELSEGDDGKGKKKSSGLGRRAGRGKE